jgi:uncharacterized protein YukE
MTRPFVDIAVAGGVTAGNVATAPLVASRRDGTTMSTGFGLIEDIETLIHGVRSGNWVEREIGRFAVSMDVLGLVLDPLGNLASWGVSWLIEHVRPLREALDWLAGDPAQIGAHAQTWRNVAASLEANASGLGESASRLSAAWTGSAASAYRSKADQHVLVVRGLSRGASGVSTVVEVAGMLVATVRALVRDLVAQFVATLLIRLPQWLAMEGVTLGLATPVVVAQVANLVRQCVSHIAKLIRALVTSLRRLSGMLDELCRLMAELRTLLRRIAHPPTAPAAAAHATPAHAPPGASAATSLDPPVDPTSGYRIQERDLAFLGLTPEDLGAWARREAPLGMSPETYREWRTSLLDALRRDGIAPDLADVRLRGSAADFFSGVHKRLPTADELAGNPEAATRLRGWLGDDPNRPTGRPFDSMHRLGLDDPSDYDINVSSGEMFERARLLWDEKRFGGELVKDHGYLNKDLVRSAFPNLDMWAREWEARTGRVMSYALFDANGPADVSHLGHQVHFRDSDWMVHRPGDVEAASTAVDVGPAQSVLSHAPAERGFFQGLTDDIVTSHGEVTVPEVAKTGVITSVTDRLDVPLDRLVAAGAAPHVDPALVSRLGDGDYVIALRNPSYPSMGGELLHRGALDPANPLHGPEHLVAMDAPGTERLVREMAVSELIQSWAHTSNGTNPRSLAIQEAARAEFGLGGVLDWPMSDSLRARVAQEVADHGDVHRQLLGAQFERTQQELRRQGINDLVLYRAYSWPDGDAPAWAAHPQGSTIEMPLQRPLSSWTGERQIAEQWASGSAPGVVLAARFPAEAILAYPQTGIGCLWQREFVVLAGPGSATLDVVNTGR